MAQVKTDNLGNLFVNVSQRTGAAGRWDDLMVVQAMLLEYWRWEQKTPGSHSAVPKEPAVDGRAHKETSVLIAEFQRRYMKRKRPQGYINPVVELDKISSSTIWNLNVVFGMAIPDDDPINYLVTTYPPLGTVLRRPSIEHEPLQNIVLGDVP
jgi:hypothetical protein